VDRLTVEESPGHYGPVLPGSLLSRERGRGGNTVVLWIVELPTGTGMYILYSTVLYCTRT